MEPILKGLEFAVELVLAELIFLMDLKRKKYFVQKAVIGFALLACLFIVLPNVSGFFSSVSGAILGYGILFALSVGYAGLLFQAPRWNILFCCIAGYVTQHFAFNLHMIIQEYFLGADLNVFSPLYWGSVAVIYSLSYLSAWTIFAKKLHRGDCSNIGDHALISIMSAILFLTIVLSILSNIGEKDLFTLAMIRLYSCLGCALALTLQFGLLDKSEMKRELETVQRLMRQEQKQYEIAKETTEFIDVLCHDLKHQLVQPDTSVPLSPPYLKKMEQAMDIYDSIAKTGNRTLDIILTENALRCAKDHIKLTCMADGASLSFMEDADLYSLFGNAISNAIEGVQKVTTPEKRFIGLTVKRVEDFLSIQVENYFSDEIVFSGDLPATTKGDSRYHGLGMKSMQYIAKKYGGNLSAQVYGEIFTLNIILSTLR